MNRYRLPLRLRAPAEVAKLANRLVQHQTREPVHATRLVEVRPTLDLPETQTLLHL